MRESAVEKKVVDFAKGRGITVIKLEGVNNRGKPDRMFLKNGNVLFLELKAPGKRPTELQLYWINHLTSIGFPAFWTDNPGEGIKLIVYHLLSG